LYLYLSTFEKKYFIMKIIPLFLVLVMSSVFSQNKVLDFKLKDN
jgi:hypothetical protein